MSGFTKGRWVSGGRTSQPSVPWRMSRCVSLQPPTAPFSDLERVRSRSTRCCGSAKREVCSRRAWAANKDSLLGECPASKGNHGSLDQPGTHGGSSAKATRTWSSGLWKRTGETEARACSIHKALRLCKAGSLFSPRQARTTRTPPRECDNKQGDPWVPGTSQGPIGFLGKGNAMIQRPCLVVGTVRNYRRTRGPGMFDPQRCCGSSRRGIATRPVWTAPTGTPHGSALATTGTFIGPWQQRGTLLDSSARAT
jgi:hypothetical protein